MANSSAQERADDHYEDYYGHAYIDERTTELRRTGPGDPRVEISEENRKLVFGLMREAEYQHHKWKEGKTMRDQRG